MRGCKLAERRRANKERGADTSYSCLRNCMDMWMSIMRTDVALPVCHKL